MGLPDTIGLPAMGEDTPKDQKYNYNVIVNAAYEVMNSSLHTEITPINNFFTTINYKNLENDVENLFFEQAKRLTTPYSGNDDLPPMIIDPENDTRNMDEPPSLPPLPDKYGGSGGSGGNPFDHRSTLPAPVQIIPTHPRTYTTAEINAKWYDTLGFWQPSNWAASSGDLHAYFDTLPWNLEFANIDPDPYGIGKWLVEIVYGNPPGLDTSVQSTNSWWENDDKFVNFKKVLNFYNRNMSLVA